MGKFKGTNQKAAAAAEKKAAAQSVKDTKAAAEREKELQKEWSKGANLRGQKKSEDAAMKADEAARKRREKAELLAEEEANMGGSKPKKGPKLSKKNKKKNDLSLLQATLSESANKKAKAKKQADRLKQERLKAEEEKRKQRKEEEAKSMDPLLANTQSMIGETGDAELIGRAANKALDENGATGIDGALDALDISSGNAPSKKALYNAFYEKKMIEMKEEYPNLKLSQYKEKISNLWKRSPENPDNQ